MDSRRPLHRLVYGGTIVEVWPDCCATHLPGGEAVVAAAQDNDEYRATAARLGYGADTARMMRDHEVAHTALCHLLGLPESPTLGRVGRKQPSNELTGLEEDAVLALQRFANAAGVDLFARLAGAAE